MITEYENEGTGYTARMKTPWTNPLSEMGTEFNMMKDVRTQEEKMEDFLNETRSYFDDVVLSLDPDPRIAREVTFRFICSLNASFRSIVAEFCNAQNHTRWNDVVRFFSAIRSGIEDGKIVLSGVNDVAPLQFALNCKNHGDIVHIIEHYIETGEFLDVNVLMMEEKSRILAQGINNAPAKMRQKLKALYAFDTTICEESLSLPLEIRMSFSGFYDEVTDEDLQQDSRIVHDIF